MGNTLGLCLIVRDEADLVAANIAHHLELGFDRIAIMDNASSDETGSILACLAKTYPLTIVYQPDTDYRQDEWATILALKLGELGIDWAISLDADEFIAPDGGTLRSIAAHFPDHPVICRRENILPALRDRVAFDIAPLRTARYRVVNPLGPVQNITIEPFEPKAPMMLRTMLGKCFVPLRGLRMIQRGNHDVDHDSTDRSVADGLLIRHFPLRPWVRFEQKVVHARQRFAQEQGVWPTISWHIRRWVRLAETGDLESEYESYFLTEPQIEELLERGVIIEDSFGSDVTNRPSTIETHDRF
ncbi:MAG: glycosyltransferase family 2 protein [Hyphomicrobiaceae bacterium]